MILERGTVPRSGLIVNDTANDKVKMNFVVC